MNGAMDSERYSPTISGRVQSSTLKNSGLEVAMLFLVEQLQDFGGRAGIEELLAERLVVHQAADAAQKLQVGADMGLLADEHEDQLHRLIVERLEIDRMLGDGERRDDII